MTDEHDVPRPERTDEVDGEFTVLEVFGLKLEVSNPHLADLLTMDATDALSADVKDLKDPETARAIREEAQEALPDVVLTPETPRDDLDAQRRKEMREEVAHIGESMSFTTHPDGVWESPTGVVILSRAIESSMSFAGASHFVQKITEHQTGRTGEDSAVLFITPDQQTADVFRVSIRQAHLHHSMRTVSMENLRDVARMFAQGTLDHSQAVILLAPIADIDVGEVLSVIRSTSYPDE